jgi:hypothetical protein
MRGLFVIALVVVAACSSDDDSRSVDAGADAPVSQIDGGDTGAACGGLAGSRCAEDSFCDYAEHTCGSPEAAGTCRKRPELCPDILERVCGCDGAVYNNECLAQKAGADPSDTAPCPTPPDAKRCGWRFCEADEEWKMSGSGAETTYRCE